MKSEFKYFSVGGAVRDELLGIKSKDLDLVCLGPNSFTELEEELKTQGAEIFISKPEYLTIRCRTQLWGAVDIRLARVDGEYSDGRRPDNVQIATSLELDLSSRDFTVNAIAKDVETGEIIDPFNGRKDIEDKILRCVGTASERFSEDSLRLLRAMRFNITKSFRFDERVEHCMRDSHLLNLLNNVSLERIREELFKCFKFNTLRTINFLELYPSLKDFIFSRAIWLKPTMEDK